jgi:hypothetical protein
MAADAREAYEADKLKMRKAMADGSLQDEVCKVCKCDRTVSF